MARLKTTVAGRSVAIGYPGTRAWDPRKDFNEKIWWDFDSDTLADGAIATWLDSWRGIDSFTQSDSARRPTKTADGVHFTGTLRHLLHPYEENAIRTHRHGAMVLKGNFDVAGATNGPLLAINGVSGSTDNRAPQIGWSRTSASFSQSWHSSGSTNTTSVPKGNDADWHILVWRRENGRTYLSIDGGEEDVSDNETFCPVRVVTNQDCRIGDTNTSGGPQWWLKRLFFFPNFTTDDLVRLTGWAKYRYGIVLPAEHPFYAAEPKAKPFRMPHYGNKDADWAPGGPIPTTWADETYRAQSIASLVAGHTQDWIEDFDTDPITDDTTGAGPLYAPTQDHTGFAVARRPGDTPDVISQSGSDGILAIIKSGGIWYSTNAVSVNRDGRGLTWNTKRAPYYFSTRLKFEPNGSDMYPAFWLKDATEFTDPTLPRIEIDLIEAYFGDNNGFHGSLHDWNASRVYDPRRVSDHKWLSNYVGLNPGNGWDPAVNMFDGQYHTYGGIINATHLIFTFDEVEVFRVPSRPTMYRPLYFLLSNQVWRTNGPSSATGYLYADWIKVMKGPDYAVAPPNSIPSA